jgi:hypothetical protein
MSIDESLIKMTMEAIDRLDQVMNELFKLSTTDRTEKYNIGKLGRSIGLIREFQEPIFKQHPHLIPSLPDDNEPDPPLTDEQNRIVNQLSDIEIQKIDELLLSNSSDKWRKVARVVGTTMMDLSGQFSGIPDIFYALRIKKLVNEGRLESQGNLDFMRYSEVRFPLSESE